jgi:hypothetical protein
MSASLPRSFALNEPLYSLPDNARSQLISVRPLSGSSFNAQSVVEFDIPQQGFIDPKSISIRYRVTGTAAASPGNAIMIGTPLYTPFSRLSVLHAGQQIDSVSNFNQVAHVLVQGQYSVAGKYGLQSQLGYTVPLDVSGVSTGNLEYMDGRLDVSGGNYSYTVSGPILGCMLTNLDKQIPAFAMGQLRVQFQIDSLSNMYMVADASAALNIPAAALPTAFAIDRFELCYTLTDLGQKVEADVIAASGGMFKLKSHGFSNNGLPVPSGTSGSQTYSFNNRYASIRSAFLCPNRADGLGSKWAEIVDITNSKTAGGGGDYSLQIGAYSYPQLPLSTLNKSGVLQETRRSFNNIYDSNNAMSINTVEFNKDINDVSNTTLRWQAPGKFIVGVNLNKGSASDYSVMAGTSSYGSPINAIVNMNVATTIAATLNLILNYDCILNIDPVNRQLVVKT